MARRNASSVMPVGQAPESPRRRRRGHGAPPGGLDGGDDQVGSEAVHSLQLAHLVAELAERVCQEGGSDRHAVGPTLRAAVPTREDVDPHWS
jgi:hypothetical protein